MEPAFVPAIFIGSLGRQSSSQERVKPGRDCRDAIPTMAVEMNRNMEMETSDRVQSWIDV